MSNSYCEYCRILNIVLENIPHHFDGICTNEGNLCSGCFKHSSILVEWKYLRIKSCAICKSDVVCKWITYGVILNVLGKSWNLVTQIWSKHKILFILDCTWKYLSINARVLDLELKVCSSYWSTTKSSIDLNIMSTQIEGITCFNT